MNYRDVLSRVLGFARRLLLTVLLLMVYGVWRDAADEIVVQSEVERVQGYASKGIPFITRPYVWGNASAAKIVGSTASGAVDALVASIGGYTVTSVLNLVVDAAVTARLRWLASLQRLLPAIAYGSAGMVVATPETLQRTRNAIAGLSDEAVRESPAFRGTYIGPDLAREQMAASVRVSFGSLLNAFLQGSLILLTITKVWRRKPTSKLAAGQGVQAPLSVGQLASGATAGLVLHKKGAIDNPAGESALTKQIERVHDRSRWAFFAVPQRGVAALSALAIVVSFLFPPFNTVYPGGIETFAGYGSIFGPMARNEVIAIGLLMVQWLGILIVGALVTLATKQNDR